MRYARLSAEHAVKLAETSPDEALAQAPNVKAVVGTAAIAGGWGDASASNVRIAIFAGSDAPAVIDV